MARGEEDSDHQAQCQYRQESEQLSESEPLCEGDTKVFYDFLSGSHGLSADDAFERIRDEVKWQRMSHQGGEVPRLVAVQGSVEYAECDEEEEEEEEKENEPANDKVDKITKKGRKRKITPIYRHPSDESPPLLAFTPAVDAVRKEVEKKLGHAVNHVLIQLYRDGKDYISEHSDKTLDICRGDMGGTPSDGGGGEDDPTMSLPHYIANVSLGAERVMVFRTKKDRKKKGEEDEDQQQQRQSQRQTQRAPLPHNSLCRMGLRTNAGWLHGIRQDKRSDLGKREEELAFGGCRISLTFRRIGTFLVEHMEDEHEYERGEQGWPEGRQRERVEEKLEHENHPRQPLIYGQGATSKTRLGAKPVVNGATPEAIRMLRGFGRENQEGLLLMGSNGYGGGFDWDSYYGEGFDVLHVTASPRLFLSGRWIEDGRVRVALGELGVGFARGSVAPGDGSGDGSEGVKVKFVDNDEKRTTMEGSEEILRYLDEVYGLGRKMEKSDELDPKTDTREDKTDRRRALELFDNALRGGERLAVASRKTKDEEVRRFLAAWEEHVQGHVQHGQFIAGGIRPSIADSVLWPVLHEYTVRRSTEQGGEDLTEFPSLHQYYERMKRRASVREALGI